jgi:hypothetical protein
MVERETQSDFNSFNRTIPCISDFSLEKQFQNVYTNAKFKEVQHQFGKLMKCNNSHLKSEGAISTYQVIESISLMGNRMIDKIFGVFFNEDEFDVKCTCAMFELKGILCRHSIYVLLTKKVITVSPRYILDRWRKDIKRKYTFIKSGYDAFVGNPDNQRHDKMCKNFEELTSFTKDNVKHFMDVMKNVDMLQEKYHNSLAITSSSCNKVIQSNDGLAVQSSNKVLTPIKVRRVVKPLSRRKVPAVEKATKKLAKKKKKVSIVSKPSSDKNVKRKQKKQVDIFFSLLLNKHYLTRFHLGFYENTFTQLFLICRLRKQRNINTTLAKLHLYL